MSLIVTSSLRYMIWKGLEAPRPPTSEALAAGRPVRAALLPEATDASIWTGTFGETRNPTRTWYRLKRNKLKKRIHTGIMYLFT